jgi:hypothetical protein
MRRIKSLWEDEQERREAQMRSDIAYEYGLHEDDDGDTIDDLLAERLADEQELFTTGAQQ